MRDQLDLAELFQHYRVELGYSLLACVIAVLRAWKRQDSFRNICIDGALVAILALFINHLLAFFGIADIGKAQTTGYIVAIWLGYVGFESVMSGIAARNPLFRQSKKPEE